VFRGAAALALSILTASFTVAAVAEEKTNPTIARETAESNAKTPAGRRYQTALESSLDSWLRKALEKCLKGVSKEDAVSFDVLVRLSGTGEAEEVAFEPETSVGRCAERDFRDAKYPSPPQPSWWIKIPVELR
jgi:hypothetical protein